MQSLFNKSSRFSNQLIKQTNQFNYDLFDRLINNRTLTLFIESPLSTKLLNKSTNYSSINLVTQLSKHAYSPSSNRDKQEPSCDLLKENFKTTELSVGKSPELYLLRSLERKHLRSKDKKMSIKTVTSSKWHLKNVLYLLKNHYEEEEDDRKFKNPNRFNFSMDFRNVSQNWECTITIFHPNRQEFKAISRRKTDAEENACYHALEWLKQQGI